MDEQDDNSETHLLSIALGKGLHVKDIRCSLMMQRFGLALVLIGVITLLVYVMSASNQEGDPQVLLVGACLCLLGLVLRRRAARIEKQEAQRFRLLRRKRDIELDE